MEDSSSPLEDLMATEVMPAAPGAEAPGMSGRHGERGGDWAARDYRSGGPIAHGGETRFLGAIPGSGPPPAELAVSTEPLARTRAVLATACLAVSLLLLVLMVVVFAMAAHRLG